MGAQVLLRQSVYHLYRRSANGLPTGPSAGRLRSRVAGDGREWPAAASVPGIAFGIVFLGAHGLGRKRGPGLVVQPEAPVQLVADFFRVGDRLCCAQHLRSSGSCAVQAIQDQVSEGGLVLPVRSGDVERCHEEVSTAEQN